ncbi:hypothetical protein ICN41_00280 [Polynucleobacter sp. 15G-AUS-farblos]|nr:hypothetical protein [Polynucleobacter sp. 15G-AUS-farblos]MBU3582419.1 hypothetical protein [Polynucleobacter sp. 15G-AUS-farblos]
MLKYNYGRLLGYIIAASLLLLIFTSYFAPDVMIAVTNQVWALCGW